MSNSIYNNLYKIVYISSAIHVCKCTGRCAQERIYMNDARNLMKFDIKKEGNITCSTYSDKNILVVFEIVKET